VRDVNVVVEAAAVDAAANEIARRLLDAIATRGRASFAVSRGEELLRALAAADTDVPWEDVGVWQVDERVAPDGDPERNAVQLDGFPADVHLMPVTAPDLAAATADYAATLPDRFDVIHLGVGPDGHTASWPPGDPVIEASAPVGLSREYQGRVRMTLTPPVIDAARARVILVTGDAKAAIVARWLGGDDTLPVARVPDAGTTVVLDPAAAAGLGRDGGIPRAADT
jgi:6-phosphogluconolactonase/glucosamine-6-phosphate isomerase/deaminase